MMVFRQLKQRIIDTLKDAAAGRFDVLGHQRQFKSGDTINQKPLVQVFGWRSELPRSRGVIRGPFQQKMTYTVWLTVFSAATADLKTLEDETSTAEDRAIATLNMRESGAIADETMDQLIEDVMQVLLDARNQTFGISKKLVADRWVDNWQKNDVPVESEMSALTAEINISFSVREEVKGETPIEPTDVVTDSKLDIDGDDVEETGVRVPVTP